MYKVYKIYKRLLNGLNQLLDVFYDSRSAGYALAEFQSRFGYQNVYLKISEAVNE